MEEEWRECKRSKRKSMLKKERVEGEMPSQRGNWEKSCGRAGMVGV